MKEEVRKKDKEIFYLSRQKKRAKTQNILTLEKNGKLMLLQYFDNGDIETTVMIENRIKYLRICQFNFCDIHLEESYFAIVYETIETGEDYIIGKKERLSVPYIEKLFILSNLKFGNKISSFARKQILYECFAPLIMNSINTMEIQGLAGWGYHDCIFYFKEMSKLSSYFSGKEIPVLDRSFSVLQITDYQVEAYFNHIKNIKNMKNRIFIMLYPILGILNSLFRRYGKPVGFYLNFVEFSPIYAKTICSWMQIFNRRNLSSYNLIDCKSAKQLNSYLATLKDEVLIIDARADEEEENYRKKKAKGQIQRIADIMTGKEELVQKVDGKVEASLVTISIDKLLGSVYNIVIDEDFFVDTELGGETFISSRCMEAFLSEFVIFVQANWQYMISTIRKTRNYTDKNSIVLDIAYELSQKFWEQKGYTIYKKANLPELIDFSEFSEDTCVYDEKELVAIFVKTLRMNISSYRGIKKEYDAEFFREAFYYDTENIYFPSFLLREIFINQGWKEKFNEMLLALKKEGILKTRENNLVRKIQIGNRRFQCYQILRKALNSCGKVDIVVLAKEEEDV